MSRLISIKAVCRAFRSALMAVLLLSLALVTSSARAGPGTPPPAVDAASIDAYLGTQVAADRYVGLAVAITHGDQIIYMRGFGSDGHGRPMTPQTLFPMASTSKSFAALAVMQLVEEGKVELDAPVQRYLPWWQLADPQGSAGITVRHLLTQTGGLGPDGYDESRLDDEASLEDAVRDLRNARLVHPVGTTFDYFDPNYWTLSLIVQTVAGQPYDQYLAQHVYGPLGMPHSTNIVLTDSASLARGYNPALSVPVSFPEVINQPYLVGCCGVVASAEEMSHYLIAQLNGGRYGGRQVLSAEGIRQLHTAQPAEGFPFQPPINYTGYGMGWFLREAGGTPVLEAPGSNRTTVSDVVLLPEQGYGIVLLYNQGGILSMLFGRQVLDGLIALLAGGQPTWRLSLGLLSLLLAAFFLLTVGLEVRALARLGRWAASVPARSVWHSLAGIASPLLLAVLLGLVLAGLRAMFGFSFPDLFMWLPDVVGWLALLCVLNLALGLARAWLTLRGGAAREPATTSAQAVL